MTTKTAKNVAAMTILGSLAALLLILCWPTSTPPATSGAIDHCATYDRATAQFQADLSAAVEPQTTGLDATGVPLGTDFRAHKTTGYTPADVHRIHDPELAYLKGLCVRR